MTGFLWISVMLALAIPLVTRGSYTALLFDTRWEWTLLFAGGVALSIASERLPSPGGFDLGFGALVASYALLLAFCGRNLPRAGMAVVLIGLAANAVAITVNHGMPVKVPHAWEIDGGLRTTVKHHPANSSTHVYWITDVIYVPPTDEVISFGDLILAIGLIDVAFEGSRRRRRVGSASESASERALRGATASGWDAAIDRDTVSGRLAVSHSAPDELVRLLPRDERRSAEVAAGDDAFERVDDPARPSVGVPRS